MFQVRTAQSRQKLNVYKQGKQVQSLVSIDIIRYAPYVNHLSMSSPIWGGGGGHRVGILTFFATPGQRIIVKISRNKWFTSHLLFKIDRSNT